MKMNGKLVIVGFDSGEKQLDAIRSGDEAGAVTQNPIGIGYDTVQAAAEALQGKNLPKRIDTGFYWYDKSNIDDPKIAAVLYKCKGNSRPPVAANRPPQLSPCW